MLRTNTKIVRGRIRQYLLDASYDYASECLEKENPTDQEIMRFVVDDINRVMGYRKIYGAIPFKAVVDYLQGLALAVECSYWGEWQKLNAWTEDSKDIQKATDREVEKANEKYWNLLAMEIDRWIREAKDGKI